MVGGVHDFGAAGLVHAVAGFFALGVLINLGPRIGKFNEDGSANHIAGHSLPLTLIGLMTIIVGFWGFLMACLIVPGEGWSWYGDKLATIYGTPITLSSLAFNILMGFAGGMSIQFVLPQMGAIFDSAKAEFAGGADKLATLSPEVMAEAVRFASVESFQAVAVIPLLLLPVFGVIWLYDRKNG